ncbi:ankyrin repeat domain-containing protein [Psychroserpens sp. S379A]|uniref:ankyrin repeat domain-containing protein n=1 Tax=Psychroserpens sp. S379A TaxID=3415137 RepID=UPI003C7BBD0D
MKKSVVIVAIAMAFSVSTLNAKNVITNTSTKEVVAKKSKISPLCEAAAKGNVEEVKKLINNGVDVNAKSNGMMPIHYAAKYNRVEIIKILITAGSKIHRSCDQGYSALRLAQKSKAKDAEQFLKRFKDKTA